MRIDINCDLGEGIENEHLLMPLISSCNIACGGHFGDEFSIDKTIQLAIENNVKIGAHPSFPDFENFGRKKIDISMVDLIKSIQFQMNLLLSRLLKFNQKLHHIKPHGALYNEIAKDSELAKTFFKAIHPFLKNVYLYVPYNSVIEHIAIKNKVPIKYEVFADRNYNDSYSLVSRAHKNALINKKEAVLQHIVNIVKSNEVKTISQESLPIKADTFCIHGDSENAYQILKYLNKELPKNQIFIDK